MVLGVCCAPPSLYPILGLPCPALPRSPGVLPVTFPRQPRFVAWNPQGLSALFPHEFPYGPLLRAYREIVRAQSHHPSYMVGKTVLPQGHKMTGCPDPAHPSLSHDVSSGQNLPIDSLLSPAPPTGPPKACPAYEPLPPASFQLQFTLMELVLEQEPIHEEHPGLFHFLTQWPLSTELSPGTCRVPLILVLQPLYSSAFPQPPPCSYQTSCVPDPANPLNFPLFYILSTKVSFSPGFLL